MEVAVLSPEQLDERLAHAYEAGYRRAVADGAGDSRSIVPGALYTAQEAAHLLRFDKRPKSLADIPERELPRLRIGQGRGSVRYWGASLLAYVHGIEQPDVRGIVDEAARSLHLRLSRPTSVRPAEPGRHQVR